MNRTCICCGKKFKPYPTVPRQRYCSDPLCQKTRHRQWQKEKIASDGDYRENQARAMKEWIRRNPDYWRDYRQRNPAYTERNRALQRERNRRKRQDRGDGHAGIAKMGELTHGYPVNSGSYRLVPVSNDGVAKMDPLIVKLEVISTGYAMGAQQGP